MIADFLGMPLGVFFGFTLLVSGAAAWLSGRALANGWRPTWNVIPYAMALALTDRFLVWALFSGDFFPARGLLAEATALLVITFLGYRRTQTMCMVSQYPWLYEQASPLHWRPVGSDDRRP